jgi:hypothetical protein
MSAEPIALAKLSEQEQRYICWKAGDLSYMVLPHQRDVYDAFWTWQATKHLIEKRRAWGAAGFKYYRLWCWEIARRWGKTVLALLIIIEFCIRRPGSVGLLCTAYQNSIGSIILKILRTVFEPEAPPGYCPVYRASKDGEHHLLWIPATNSTITLVGLDLHSDKTRGNFQDFVYVTEAGFVSPGKLDDTFRGVITPQFRGRPHAWALFESSTSPVPDHEFQTRFKEDCEGRGTHVLRTIDQTDLTAEEIEMELAELGGRETAIAQREAYCRIIADEQRAVCPSFNELLHVVPANDVELPLYALAYTSLDPGVRDKCGIVFFYLDFIQGLITVQSTYAESNKNTDVIASVIRSTEQELWQATPIAPKPPRDLRIQDLLKPTTEMRAPGAGLQHATEIIGAKVLPGAVVWDAPQGALTWWDDEKRSLRANPARRVSDVATQMQLDLRQLHGLSFETAVKGKGSKRAHINNLDVLLKQCRLRIIKNEANKALIAQLRSGRWNEKRTDFEESKTLGHLDALMALAYGVRVVAWELNPWKPAHVDPHAPDLVVPEEYQRKVLRPVQGRKRYGR